MFNIWNVRSQGKIPTKNNNFISFEYDEKPNGMHYSFEQSRVLAYDKIYYKCTQYYDVVV